MFKKISAIAISATLMTGCATGSGNQTLWSMAMTNPQTVVDEMTKCTVSEIISEFGAPDSAADFSTVTTMKYNITPGGEKQLTFVLNKGAVTEVTYVENIAFGNTYKSMKSCPAQNKI